MPNGMEEAYERFYRGRSAKHLYPVEFVVRAFLGTYPRLKAEPDRYKGLRALDLGYGDGRNVPLLFNLGMSVSGVEISEMINEIVGERMAALGIPFDARLGRNRAIPFDDAAFDVVLACHSCYYVDESSSFDENIEEIARVTRSGGRFVFSAPMIDSYILDGAQDLGGGHKRIVKDPYGLRAGNIMRAFADEREIRKSLAPFFDGFVIGSCRNDFWGIEERVWTVVCRRTDTRDA